jgi:hypothetical protein
VTLVITILGKNKVVQVSDCRLTLNGEVYDADATKVVGVTCADAQFSIGYAGVGEIEGKRTDYWLVDQIRSIFASGHYGIKALSWELAVRAEEAMPQLSYQGRLVKPESRILKLVIAGYHDGENGALSQPFMNSISNTRFRGFDVPLDVEPIFTISPGTLRPDIPDNHYSGSIQGAAPAIMAEDKHAKETLKQLQQVMRWLRRVDLGEKPSGVATAERLVSVLRRASRHPKYGYLVGRDCLSVVIHPNSRKMPTHYHVEQATTITRLPHLVTPWYEIVDAEFRWGPKQEVPSPNQSCNERISVNLAPNTPDTPSVARQNEPPQRRHDSLQGSPQDRLRGDIESYFRSYYKELRDLVAAHQEHVAGVAELRSVFYRTNEAVPDFFVGYKEISAFFCEDDVAVVHYPAEGPQEQDAFYFCTVAHTLVKQVIDSHTNPLPNGDGVGLIKDYELGEDFGEGSYPVPFMVDDMVSVVRTGWTRLDWAHKEHLDRWHDPSEAPERAREIFSQYVPES